MILSTYFCCETRVGLLHPGLLRVRCQEEWRRDHQPLALWSQAHPRALQCARSRLLGHPQAKLCAQLRALTVRLRENGGRVHSKRILTALFCNFANIFFPKQGQICQGHDTLLEAERRVRHQLLLGQGRVGEAAATQDAQGFGRKAGPMAIGKTFHSGPKDWNWETTILACGAVGLVLTNSFLFLDPCEPPP